LYDVSLSVQLAKALAVDEREMDKENLVDDKESLGAKREILRNYFVRGWLAEDHTHEVYYSNRTMTAAEITVLLPEAVRTLYKERRRLMDWALMRLERRIKVYARGERFTKWVIMVRSLNYSKKLFLPGKKMGATHCTTNSFTHASGSLTCAPSIFTDFQENTWTYQMYGGSLTKTFMLEDRIKRIQASHK
jgi:hypothetical protein